MAGINFHFGNMLKGFAPAVAAAMVFMACLPPADQPRLIEVLADKDSRFKISGQKQPEITVKAGEPLLFRITARKGKTWNRDGAVHGFTLLHSKTHKKVAGWDFELKPGVQDLPLNAPTEPGEYEILCTVICSDDHEGMTMRFVVLP